MWTIVICIVVGVLWGSLANPYEPDIGGFAGGFMGLVGGFLLALMIGAAAYSDTEWKPAQATPLVSINDGSATHGRFFLGSGSIDSEPSFTWYESNGANSFVRKQVDADHSTVHYLTDNRKPYYVRWRGYYLSKNFIQRWGLMPEKGYNDKEHYDFYIPKGSIVNSYKLDNQ